MIGERQCCLLSINISVVFRPNNGWRWRHDPLTPMAEAPEGLPKPQADELIAPNTEEQGRARDLGVRRGNVLQEARATSALPVW